MTLAWAAMWFCGIGLAAVAMIVLISWWQVTRKASSNPFFQAVYGWTVGIIFGGTTILLAGLLWGIDARRVLLVATLAGRVEVSPRPATSPAEAAESPSVSISVRPATSPAELAVSPNVVGLAVDIKANGSDGPITIRAGESYTYEWSSSNATSCQLTSPANSGIPVKSKAPLSLPPGNPFYPTANAPVILTIVCTDNLTTVTDAVTIAIVR